MQRVSGTLAGMDPSLLLSRTVLQAPMAGGPSTPELAAAVSGAGGLGFLAGGYRTVDELRSDIRRTRSLTPAPFGVNLFVPTVATADPEALRSYLERLRPEADRLGVGWDVGQAMSTGSRSPSVGGGDGTDSWDGKVDMLLSEGVDLASFTFGPPSPSLVQRFHDSGATVVATVTTVDEAVRAQVSGADALCVQAVEAGGHQGSFIEPDRCRTEPLPALLTAVRQATSVPLIAAGGLPAEAAAVREALDRGASAVSLGTAFLLTPECGAHAAYKAALTSGRFASTRPTRAFSGRWARALENRFVIDHSPVAPTGYPVLNRLTAPLRRAAADRSDWESMALWAGTGFRSAQAVPAAAVTATLLSQLGHRTSAG